MDVKADLGTKLFRAAQRLRQIGRLAIGRLTGTCTTEDGRYKQLIDIEETRLFMRFELNAVTKLLLEKKIVTELELQVAMLEEAEHLEKSLLAKWPEIKSIAPDGSSYALDIEKMRARTKREGWPP